MAVRVAARARPSGQVDRDPLGEHDLDAARPRPGAVRRGRAAPRRHHRRAAVPGRRRRRRVRRVRRDARVRADPHDGAGRLPDPEDRLRRRGRRHQPRADGRVPGGGTPRGARRCSSASSTWPRPSSAWTRSSCGGATSCSPTSSRTRPSPGSTYDIGDYDAALTEALRIAGYDELRAEQAGTARARRREAARDRHRPPTSRSPSGGSGASSRRSRCTPTARATVKAGTSAHGQGHATAYSQLVVGRARHSDREHPLRAVRHRARSRGRRHRRLPLPAARRERGARARRRGARTGPQPRGRPARGRARRHRAVGRRHPRRRRRAVEVGHLVGGRHPGRRRRHAAASSSTTSCSRARRSRSVPTSRSSRSTPRPDGSSPSATSPSTTAAASSIRMLVDGQVHGGLASGIAQALWEEMVYDDDGNPLTSTLAEYAHPERGRVPARSRSRTPRRRHRSNPLGAKGIGESATVGSTPAVQNAVVDALSHLGVRHIDMPLHARARVARRSRTPAPAPCPTRGVNPRPRSPPSRCASRRHRARTRRSTCERAPSGPLTLFALTGTISGP